jgi:HSP20 family protein
MTSLVRYYSPLDRVFAAAFPNAFDGEDRAQTIKLDVVETPEAYIVKALLPGVAKDQIEVKVEDRDVTISVETKEETQVNGKALWKELSYGKASRAIRLPEAVDTAGAQAKHVDGVLQLTLPKNVKATSKITIQ